MELKLQMIDFIIQNRKVSSKKKKIFVVRKEKTLKFRLDGFLIHQEIEQLNKLHQWFVSLFIELITNMKILNCSICLFSFSPTKDHRWSIDGWRQRQIHAHYRVRLRKLWFVRIDRLVWREHVWTDAQRSCWSGVAHWRWFAVARRRGCQGLSQSDVHALYSGRLWVLFDDWFHWDWILCVCDRLCYGIDWWWLVTARRCWEISQSMWLLTKQHNNRI